jgi:hypothetical protein
LQEQTFEIDAVYFHEEYNVGVYLNHDIAVVRLKANPGRLFVSKFFDKTIKANFIVFFEKLWTIKRYDTCYRFIQI